MRIFNLFCLFILFSLIYSCNTHVNGNKENMIKIDTLKNKIEEGNRVYYKQETDSLIKNKNFQKFWLGFRNIVLSQEIDKIDISAVINFPFEVYGFEDSDPRIILMNTDSINIVFRRFLLDSTCVEMNTHYEMIKNVINLEEFSDYTRTKYSRSVGSMVFYFNFMDGENTWKLTRIYIDTKKLKN